VVLADAGDADDGGGGAGDSPDGAVVASGTTAGRREDAVCAPGSTSAVAWVGLPSGAGAVAGAGASRAALSRASPDAATAIPTRAMAVRKASSK